MVKKIIFIAEDDEWYAKLLNHTLSLNPDYEIFTYTSGTELLNNIHLNPVLITVDYKLPDMNGADLLKKIKAYNEDIEVIVISGQDDIETAVDLLKEGAYDYIVKTKDIRERLLNTANNALKNDRLKEKISVLQKEVEKKFDFKRSIIGESEAIKKVFLLMEKAIQTNITVSINGETGTGKELVAKAIHFNSDRKKENFIAVNVAAIPSELIESELFGHEKGAFTGANFKRVGKFEEADKGTLFLDEIGEMDLVVQTKILRALQEREITPVGSNKTKSFNCRIIVASHKNLQEEVRKGTFREDLYYRLLGLPIYLPPLRERDKDALILAKHFINVFCKENGIPAKQLTLNAQKKLLSYPFPGNIRELKAQVELATVMSSTDEITENDINFISADTTTGVFLEECTMKEYELRILKTFLNKYNNNIKLVAEKLNIGQSTIYRMLKEVE
ncbi:MAG: sigma-54-dependent transcriptional regulator [Flavobacteriales bacterium]